MQQCGQQHGLWEKYIYEAQFVNLTENNVNNYRIISK